jgi:ubiquinol-cytochrome c reductase cytochrome c1 subunit
MNLLKKLIAVLAFVPLLAMASEGEYPLDHAPDRTKDLAALQHGAKLFVNYCLNCHSASLMRYNRLRDLGLTEDEIKANLLFTTDKVGGLMTIALAPKDAKEWFGVIPPDLSVIARAKTTEAGSGPDWIYTYLRSYYVDDSRPTGWNNMLFPNVGMPHIFWELQGEQNAVFKGEGAERKFDHFELVKQGKLSKVEYDSAVADLVGYLEWQSEPVRNLRHRLGVVVLLFLAVFAFFAWRLNASYWKEIK